MQLYDITIAPNTTRQLDAPGSYFYYYSGSAGGADSTITMRGLSSGLRIVLKPGQAFRLPRGESETSWVLTNFSNTATIIGTVIVGDGDITDNRVTGSVEVIDGSETRSFINSFSVAPAILGTAANITQVQLWNPPGSGKNLFCKRFNASVTVTGQVSIGNTQTQINASAFTPRSKYLIAAGAPTSAATCGARSTSPTTVLTTISEAFYLNSGAVLEIKPDAPFIIAPGNGLTFETQLVNTSVFATFDYYEKSTA